MATARLRWLWRADSRGVVYSATEVHRAPSPAFASTVPYVVVLVRADAGGMVMARAGGAVAPAICMPVLVVRAGAALDIIFVS